MYYFYVIKPFSRIGFGITQDYADRNKKYCSHCGELVPFVRLYGGLQTKSKKLERDIKRQYAHNIWVVDDWKTEWLNQDVKLDDFVAFLESIIVDKHLDLRLVAENITFQDQLDLTNK